ncbi:hypothetical protein M1O54_03390 [Dehalococcoidia bacterium]|nr:hypothetical protein [Dehalococcoidia bacterium]MCL0089386.1 hypothetical protein [Dehalococcoidia bacterium]
MNLNLETAMYFRDQFREARATALQDAEGFQEILFVLERFGAYLTRSIGTLGSYANEIRGAALNSPLADHIPTHCQSWHVPFSQLYELVREARNDALHQGAFARHLTDNAIQLALVLEDALMSNQNTAGDYMVREPVCASLWQPLSFIRQEMLVNSFTYLPVWSSRHWLLISDYHVAQYLRKGDRKARLAKTLEDAVDEGLILEQVSTCVADSPINEVLEKSKGKPVLVIEREQVERLVGIVTPFDLL